MTGKPQDKRKRSFQMKNLPGWPGYRNRPNRSGLDPVDTYLEEAFMEGMFLRRLITLQLRTKNRFFLGLMFLAGLVSILISIPFWAIIPLEWDSSHSSLGLKILGLLIVTGVPLAAGILFLVNFVLSIATDNHVNKMEETPKRHLTKRKQKNPLNAGKTTNKIALSVKLEYFRCRIPDPGKDKSIFVRAIL